GPLRAAVHPGARPPRSRASVAARRGVRSLQQRPAARHGPHRLDSRLQELVPGQLGQGVHALAGIDAALLVADAPARSARVRAEPARRAQRHAAQRHWKPRGTAISPGEDLRVETSESLLGQLTLEEKVALISGSDAWHSSAVPRLRIPRFKMSDGPSGVRGDVQKSHKTSVCFPAGVALAATWDPGRIEQIGAALAEEARSKGVHVVLAPTVNLHRTPLGGRNF